MDSSMSGPRITVPPLKIELYKQGFDDVCKLDRTSDGKKLSDLVERISEPLVIALDAPWGAGKSVFLQCWVGAHTFENKGTATTVYFDAFKHDYMDDPLVSIIQAISERIEDLTPKEEDPADISKIDTMKRTVRKATVYAPALGRAALRMGVAVGTGGLIRNIDDVAVSLLDEAAKQGAKELDGAIGNFWKTEEARTNAMEGFRKYLKELAAEQKLVIVVDELDRCRPDYALNLLEVIKHFFDVDNVHFVLGVNLKELENSVKARYGSGVDAGTYLQKFITAKMPFRQTDQHGRNNILKHLMDVAAQLGIKQNHTLMATHGILKITMPTSVSLRTVEKIATQIAISASSGENGWDSQTLYMLRGCLVIIKEADSDLYRRILDETAIIEDLESFFKLDRNPEATGSGLKRYLWPTIAWTFDKLPEQTFSELNGKIFPPKGAVIDSTHAKTVLRTIALQELEVFQLGP